jgi:DNA processing protein
MKIEPRIWPKKMWPKSIHEIPQPPKLLRIRGQPPDLDLKRICIVGSRKYSEYGETVCKKIISGLRDQPISIISGLAFGIDSIAHKAALENDIHSIVIPGSGLNDDSIYPRSHFNLAMNVLNAGGCLISEFENDFRATNWAFPQRNRIMVGLADLVLIIEAKEKSGSMITARMAIDYNKELSVVPGSVLNRMSEGPNSLAKDGAHVITCAEDVLDLLDLKFDRKKTLLKKLTPAEKTVYDEITYYEDPNNFIDNLITRHGMKIEQINRIISSLEINDLIHYVDGRICQK